MASVYVLADLHSRFDLLEANLSDMAPRDALILVGDLWGGEWHRLRQMTPAELSMTIHQHYSRLREMVSGRDVFTVKGNWDPDLYYDYFGSMDLCGRLLERDGTTFTGFSHGTDSCQPRILTASFFQRADPPMVRQTLEAAQFWFSHYPPRGTLDELTNDEYGFTMHVGDQALARALAEIQPDGLYCGHMHRQEEKMLGRTRVVLSYGMPGQVIQVPQCSPSSQRE